MNRKTSFVPGIGIPSIILVVVVLCLSILAVLAFVSAKNDAALADRSVEVATSVYLVEADAEKTAARLDGMLLAARDGAGDWEEYLLRIEASLPAEALLDKEAGSILWTEEDGGRTLSCRIEVTPLDEPQRFVWKEHKLIAATEEETWN